MTWRRRASRPVPLAPTHRRDWRTFWRRCTCGLTSPCVDRLAPAALRPFPPRTATATHPPAGSHEERSPRFPALIEYLATVPFPVHFGVAVLRAFPTEPTPSPDSPEPSLPRAPADHPGGDGALGGPGSRPCPGFRAGAAPFLPHIRPHTPTIGRTHRRPDSAAAPFTPRDSTGNPIRDRFLARQKPETERRPEPTETSSGTAPAGRPGRRRDSGWAPPISRRDGCGEANQTSHRRCTGSAAPGRPGRPVPARDDGGESKNGSKPPKAAGDGWRPKAAGDGWQRLHQGCGRRRAPRPFHPALSRSWIHAAVGDGGRAGEHDGRAGERVGRPGAGELRAGSNGGRRGRLPTFGGRPAMAYHHINLSRR